MKTYAQQSITITGTVSSDENEHVIGASVSAKGLNLGTATDTSGHFKLILPAGRHILTVSSLGYLPQDINVTQTQSVNLKLKRRSTDMNEVVVVGYGKNSKRLLTGAVQSLNGDTLKDMPTESVTQKLQGKLSGVQIDVATGEPGASLQVAIRGAASISTDASPLYVVDGFPIQGDLRDLDPDQVESISVLKDATATSLYGSRAAFGVVLVTTKGATTGKTKISFNAYTGIQHLPQKGRPQMMDGEQWAEFRKEMFQDAGQPVPSVFQNPSQYGKGYDWYGAFFRNAAIQNYNLSISSGTERLKNALEAGFFDQDGIMINSGYKRFAIRNNTTYQLAKNLTIGLNLAPSYSVNYSPPANGWFNGGQGLLMNALLTPPILPYQNADGSMPTAVTKPGVTTFPTTNWVRSAEDITRTNTEYNMLANAYLEYRPIKDLILKSTFNVQTQQDYYNSFIPSTASVSFATEPSQQNASMAQNTNHFYTWLNENTAEYSKNVGLHSFDLLAGYTIQKYRYDNTSISGYNFPDDRIQTIDEAITKNNATQDIQEWSLLSSLARFNYNYDKKYLFSASVREDGSSRFGQNNKYGVFPAVSAGWVASEESFLKNINWLSFLKIRGGYGVVGNNNIGNYTQYSTVSSSNAIFNNSVYSGIAVTGLGNANLGWERTAEADLGLELGVLNGRINFSYDYYNKVTSNLLLGVAVPQESGFGGEETNVGKVRFWGHEFSIDTKNLVGAFRWNTNFNISFSDNKVLALSTLTDEIFSTGVTGIDVTITKVGGRIGQFWGLVQEGVYKNQADLNNSPKAIDSEVGTIKFADLNHDGKISFGNTDGDRTVIGNPFPKFVYGMTNAFSYKNFDLSITMAGSYGNDIARMSDAATTNLDGVFNVLQGVTNRFRSPSDPGSGIYGTTTVSTTDERGYFHSGFIFSGSYLAVKNISLGYTWPLHDNKVFSSVRLYSSVQQAFVFTKYQGNPEIDVNADGSTGTSLSRGLDYGGYPIPRTITLGFNVNLK